MVNFCDAAYLMYCLSPDFLACLPEHVYLSLHLQTDCNNEKHEPQLQLKFANIYFKNLYAFLLLKYLYKSKLFSLNNILFRKYKACANNTLIYKHMAGSDNKHHCV